MEEYKSEYTITEKKDAGNEVTYDVPNFNVSNIFECGRNNHDVTYERASMATSGYESFRDTLNHLKNIMIVTAKYFPVKISKKLFSASWKRKKKKLNTTSITLHVILHLSLLSL